MYSICCSSIFASLHFFIMMIWQEIQYLSSSSMIWLLLTIYVNSVFLIDYLMVTLLDSVRLSILRGRIVSRTHETGSHVIFSLNECSLLL